MTPWWVSLVAAGIAVLGGAAGAGITHGLTARRDRQQFERLTARQDAEWRRQRADKLRDTRAQLYLDLMEFLENLTQQLNYDPAAVVRPRPPIPDVHHPGRLNARIRLYADSVLHAAWVVLEDANHEVLIEARARGEDDLRPATVSTALRAVEAFQVLLRERVSSVD